MFCENSNTNMRTMAVDASRSPAVFVLCGSISSDEKRNDRPNGSLKLSARYSSFAQLQKSINFYCQEKNIRLFRSDTRKLKSAHIRVNANIIKKTPECLIYYSLTYTCVFGSRKFKNTQEEFYAQSSSNYNTCCKFTVKVGLSKDYQFLQVIKMSDPSIHNHPSVTSSKRLCDSKIFSSSNQSCNSIIKSFTDPLEMPEKLNLPSNPMHSKIISTKLHEYRSSGLFCDTVIAASNEMVYAHSFILGMFCPKLFVLLNRNPYHNLQPNMINLARYPSSLINKLLDFFYLGKLCMDQFDELQELASHLGVIFNVNRKVNDPESSFNEDGASTRTSSECDNTNSDHGDSDQTYRAVVNIEGEHLSKSLLADFNENSIK